MKIAEHFDKPSRIERILIIQLGDIGDVVWSLPALRAVREAYPDAAVAMLLREGNGELLAADISPPIRSPARRESTSLPVIWFFGFIEAGMMVSLR